MAPKFVQAEPTSRFGLIQAMERDALLAFEQARPGLLGLAYRILGTRADAEDAVQDTFLKWQANDRSRIDNPTAWLTTVCTRDCRDILRSADRARVEYVGAALPKPVRTAGRHAGETRQREQD